MIEQAFYVVLGIALLLLAFRFGDEFGRWLEHVL